MAQGKLSPEAKLQSSAWKTMDKVLGFFEVFLGITDKITLTELGFPLKFCSAIEGEEEAPRKIMSLRG
jgi:hypothetical protein